MSMFNWGTTGDNVLTYALQTSFAVSALIAIVLILRKPVARLFGARAAYALWALPLVRLILPPLPSNWAPLAKLWPTKDTAPVETTADAVAAIYMPVPVAEATPALEETARSGSFTVTGDITPVVSIDWSLVALAVWAAGCFALIALTLLRQNRFMNRIKSTSMPVSSSVTNMTADIQKEMGLKVKVSLVQTTMVRNPMVTGLKRPTIILPTDFEISFTEHEQEASLAHELTHIKRGDLWALAFGHLFLALQWLNPLAHHGIKLFRTDQEAACDSDVLDQGSHTAHAYGATLVKAVKLAQPVTRRKINLWQSDGVGPLAPALPLNHAVKERLTRLQSPAPSRALRTTGTAIIALVGAGALAATASASSGSESLTLDRGTLHFDGVALKDRRFVLLSDPFEKLQPEMAKMHNMHFDIEMPEIPAMPALPVPPVPPSGMWSEAKMAAFEIKMEKFEEDVDRIMEKYEEQIEAMEEKIEIKSEAMEERVEEVMTEKFEARLNEAGDLIGELADRCKDYTFTDETRVILTAQPSYDDKEVRALCLKGGKEELHSAATDRFIKQSKKICSAEKDRFFSARKSTMSFGEYRHD